MENLTQFYWIAVLSWAVSICYGAFNLEKPWGIPYITVLLTIAAWYLLEPLYLPENFNGDYNARVNDMAFIDILLFFIFFSIATPILVRALCKNVNVLSNSKVELSAEDILVGAAVLWGVLLVFGVILMNGDLFGALFPIKSRNGSHIFARAAGADAGAGGFMLSTASYVYDLLLASFGILLVLVRKRAYRSLAIALILLTWPYAFLLGSRSVTLTVTMPGIMCFLLFSKQSKLSKIFIGTVFFIFLDLAFKAIILYRNIGFENINWGDVEAAQHNGLGMCSELIYTISFVDEGIIKIDFGLQYILELANVIPRAIWADKPLIGIDYAIARGFSSVGTGINSDTGVTATVSTGMLGQAVLSFGAIFGPVFAATLMGLWVAMLARFREQGTALRRLLFLVGLGVTFNLGRDITLLVLWPFVFCYIGVRFLERRSSPGITSSEKMLVVARPLRHVHRAPPGGSMR